MRLNCWDIWLDKILVTTCYIRFKSQLTNVVNTLYSFLSPEVVHGINSHRAHRPYNTLSSLLNIIKTSFPSERKTGVVYDITCNSCGEHHIGETARGLGKRLGPSSENTRPRPTMWPTERRSKSLKRRQSTLNGKSKTSSTSDVNSDLKKRIGTTNFLLFLVPKTFNLPMNCVKQLKDWSFFAFFI